MAIKQMCAMQVDTISADESARTAAARMRDHLVGCLVVCDDRRRPVGMLTDRDLAVRIVASGIDATQLEVGDIMTRPARCIGIDTSLEKTLTTMQRIPCRRLPVVDDDGVLVALATLDDVLKQVARRFGQIGNLVQQESPSHLDIDIG